MLTLLAMTAALSTVTPPDVPIAHRSKVLKCENSQGQVGRCAKPGMHVTPVKRTRKDGPD